MVDKSQGHVSPQRYAQKSALHEVCRLHGLKQEWLALMLHKDQGTISKWLDVEKVDFPCFEDWNALLRLIKDYTGSIEPIQSFCHWHGADAVLLSPTGAGLDPKTLGRLTSLIARKEGAVLSLLIQILEDGHVSEDETDLIGDAYPDIEALYVAVSDLRERARSAQRTPKRRHA